MEFEFNGDIVRFNYESSFNYGLLGGSFHHYQCQTFCPHTSSPFGSLTENEGVTCETFLHFFAICQNDAVRSIFFSEKVL